MISNKADNGLIAINSTPITNTPTEKTLSQVTTERINSINQPKTFKVIVIGDSNVGKTTLTYRFCEGKFLTTSETTIGVDFRTRTVNIDGEDITVSIFYIFISQPQLQKSNLFHIVYVVYFVQWEWEVPSFEVDAMYFTHR